MLTWLVMATLGLAVPHQDQDGPLARMVTAAVPDSLPDPTHPALARPESAARFALGRKLFFDPLLSVDRTVACATCHDPAHAFADGRPRSIGVSGVPLARQAPTLVNRYLGSSFMWDGRFSSLEEQALHPIAHPDEMGLEIEEAIMRLVETAPYRALWSQAWPTREIDADTLAGSLAHFVRHIRLGDSPIDRYRSDGEDAVTPLEIRGLELWEGRARCWHCHLGPDFTDEKLHDTGVGVVDGLPADGRFGVTGRADDRGRFKTPTLRGLAFTAPYMHDGSLATLRDVVEFYRRGGGPNSRLSPLIQPLRLTERDVDALVAFLEALSR